MTVKFSDEKIAYRCGRCCMGFRVEAKNPNHCENSKCPTCLRSFWSSYLGPSSVVSVVGIDPKNIDGFGQWV